MPITASDVAGRGWLDFISRFLYLMVAKILVGMLCTHLMCFAVMFLLISRRLHPRKMGMDFFALGNFLLGSAYVLQLVEGGPAWSV